jgi:transcription antitermination factor NusG
MKYRHSKSPKYLSVGGKVRFDSGNFEGLTGIIIEINWQSKDPKAMFGYLHKVALSNGNTGWIEKFEHLTIL